MDIRKWLTPHVNHQNLVQHLLLQTQNHHQFKSQATSPSAINYISLPATKQACPANISADSTAAQPALTVANQHMDWSFQYHQREKMFVCHHRNTDRDSQKKSSISFITIDLFKSLKKTLQFQAGLQILWKGYDRTGALSDTTAVIWAKK